MFVYIIIFRGKRIYYKMKLVFEILSNLVTFSYQNKYVIVFINNTRFSPYMMLYIGFS